MKNPATLFKKILRYFFKPQVNYKSLIEVRVSQDAILHNLRVYKQKYPFLEFAPVVKSNAYGHGLEAVARILDGENVPFFVVDSFCEAVTLRHYGIKTKILILGYIPAEQIFQNTIKNVSIGIISLEQLRTIVNCLSHKKIFHLKVDTGMHRQGVLVNEVDEAIRLIKTNHNFVLEGLCTHFADADNRDIGFTNQQIIKWNRVCELFKKHFDDIKYFHAAASAGVIHSKKIFGNVCRLGIGLYGINISELEDLDLQPALEVLSVISGIKKINSGDKVGYGITFTAPKSMVIATVPLGYNEGVDRRLSNKGWFKVDNQFCPIVGRVSMNITTIDVSGIKDVKLNNEVVVISSSSQDQNSVQNIAKSCDCIPYEILVHIPQHLRRIIV